MEKCKLCGQEMSDEILAKIAADNAECEKKNALYAEAVEKWNDLYSPHKALYLIPVLLMWVIATIGSIKYSQDLVNNEFYVAFFITILMIGFLGSCFVGVYRDENRRMCMKRKIKIEHPELFSILESRQFPFGERTIPILW